MNGLDGRLAIDGQGLSSLRAAAQKNSPEAIRETAKQFEAMFLNMMLKSMREATPPDSLFESEYTRTYTAMLDQQLSQTLASRGMGLADVLVSQLTKRTDSLSPEAVSGDTAVRHQGTALRATESLSDGAFAGRQPDHVVEFRRRMLPHAEAASRVSGIPAAFIIGQAALESGWGRNEIKYADGRPSYNLFGIKATGNWNGKVVETMTTEYVNGEKLQRMERFRAYESYAEAFKDFASLISRSPRYDSVMANLHHPADYAHAMQQAGYATDPDYASKLLSVIQRTVAT